MKKIMLGVMAITMLVTLTGCETIKGIGKDLANTGENLHDLVTQSED